MQFHKVISCAWEMTICIQLKEESFSSLQSTLLNTPSSICSMQAEGRAGVTLSTVEVPRGEARILLEAVNSLSSVQQKIWKLSSLTCLIFLPSFSFSVVCKRKYLGIRLLGLVQQIRYKNPFILTIF